MRQKKAQSSIELMIVIGFLLFFFVVFLSQVQGNINTRASEKKAIVIKDIVLTVQQEVNLAAKASDGYYREFELPTQLIDEDYEIFVYDTFVYANTTSKKFAITLDIPQVNGTINKGTNIIRKEAGIIYLN